MEPMALGHLAVWKHSAKTPQPRARLIHVHGISEHSGRHQPTFDALTKLGIEVIRFDLTGSGLSGGKRQYIESFSDYVADVARVYNWVSSALPPLPLYVMGHSLGGAIAIHFTAQYGSLFQGLVLSAPGYKTGGDIGPWKVALGRALVRFVPKLRMYSASSEGLSRDKRVVEAYRNDPLSSHFNTLKQGAEILDAFLEVPDRCRQIFNPTLIIHGTSDRVILPEGSFEILQSLSSSDRELHFLPGVYHEPHLDWESEKYFALLCRWLDKRLPLEQNTVARS